MGYKLLYVFMETGEPEQGITLYSFLLHSEEECERFFIIKPALSITGK